MNLISTTEDEKILEHDSIQFYSAISKCIGTQLDPATNTVILSKPDWSSRSAVGHMVKCKINENRYVVLKKCVDNQEYMRREIVVAEAKRVLDLPYYNVIKLDSFTLRKNPENINCDLLKGWENKEVLMIDFGNYPMSKKIGELALTDIRDIKSFCFNYGRWAAFNYLFGVRDRNAGNFILFLDSQILHSIDNEEGPFDSNGNDAGVLDIINSTKQNIDRIIANANRSECITSLRDGFVAEWNKIKEKFPFFNMLNDKEKMLLQTRLMENPEEIVTYIFN